MSYRNLCEAYAKALNLNDMPFLEIQILVFLSHFLPGDPFWLFVIGPPGVGKTTILETFGGTHTQFLSFITPKSLISGIKLKNGKTAGILPEINNKVVICKDMSIIMEHAARDQILSQLRDVYDGHISGGFGSGAGIIEERVRITFIGASTNTIDAYSNIFGILGERFLKLRSRIVPQSVLDNVVKMIGEEEATRYRLMDSFNTFVNSLDVGKAGLMPVPPGQYNQIYRLSEIVGILRSEVKHDYRTDMVAYMPHPEVGSRIQKQFIRLLQIQHLLTGTWDMTNIYRLSNDALTPFRLRVLLALCTSIDRTSSSGELFSYRTYVSDSVDAISESTQLPVINVRRELNDLLFLNVVELQKGKPDRWRLRDDMIPKVKFYLECIS